MKVYTCTKPMITYAARITSNEPHVKVIAAPARNKLWLKLKDAMDRMSGILPPRVKLQPLSGNADSSNRGTYRRNANSIHHRATNADAEVNRDSQMDNPDDPEANIHTDNSSNDE